MAQEHDAFDIEHEPMLMRLVEEVRASEESRLLRIDDRTVAVLQPVSAVEDEHKLDIQHEATEADWEAFRSAAGSWKDVDVEKFLEDVYASRDASISTKAPVIGERSSGNA